MNDIKEIYDILDFKESENIQFADLKKVIKDYEEEVQCQNQWKK